MDSERRLAIALDCARGISNLHSEANPPIIHRGIKPSNILLDDKFVAKVADIGLFKLASDEDIGVTASPLSTHELRGTMGYLDPDYYMTNQLTTKSDVYSFGVVLLELVTGKMAFQGGKHVVREVRTALSQGEMVSVLQSIVDPNLIGYPPKAVERFVELALSCVEDDPESRPSMIEVVKELEHLVLDGHFLSMDIEIREDQPQLYVEGSPYYEKQHFVNSFEYITSYTTMPR